MEHRKRSKLLQNSQLFTDFDKILHILFCKNIFLPARTFNNFCKRCKSNIRKIFDIILENYYVKIGTYNYF